MSNAGASSAAAAAAHAAMVNAVKASGVIVRLDPEEFQRLLTKVRDAIIVTAEGGVFSTNYQYLLSYKGLAFFTKARAPLSLPGDCEIVAAAKIWIPD